MRLSDLRVLGLGAIEVAARTGLAGVAAVTAVATATGCEAAAEAVSLVVPGGVATCTDSCAVVQLWSDVVLLLLSHMMVVCCC